MLVEQIMSSIENDISEIDGNPAVESKQITEKQFSNQEHSFLMDQAYVKQMQDGLLEMLDNFKNGRHHGFDESCSREKMTEIKTMQENLAQLHFDLENEDSNRTALSEDEKTKRTQEKINKLMKNSKFTSQSRHRLARIVFVLKEQPWKV